MKKIVILIISLALVLSALSLAFAGQKKETTDKAAIKFYSYEEGLEKAKQDSLFVAVFFKTTWCKYCKIMDNTTLKDSRIVELLNKSFIAVKVDGDKRKDLRKEYKVKGYPETWFLEANGDKIAPAPGFWPADDFLLLLRYVDENAYKAEEFLKWAKKQNNTKG